MPNSLAKIGSNIVQSNSNPDANLLRMARKWVSLTEKGKRSFSQGKTDRDSLREGLASQFSTWGASEIGEVATYLADEYDQVGPSGILLISEVTGKPIARFTEEDLYQPAPVARENGHIVQRDPQLKPELVGALATWSFNKEDEQRVRDLVLAKTPQTDLVKDTGDPRLKVLTKSGRRDIDSSILESLPGLFGSSTGLARDFLDYFVMGAPQGGASKYTQIKVSLSTRVRRPIQDLSTTNVGYDFEKSTKASITTGWVRALGEALLMTSEGRCLQQQLLGPFDTSGFWVAEPNLAMILQNWGCQVLASPAKSTSSLHFRGPIGFLEILPEKLGLHSRELHGRWTITATAEATIWVDWDQVDEFLSDPVVESGVSVEVVNG